MHLILTGATGLVGSAVLDAMVRSTDLTRISILSRRPVAMAQHLNDPRIHVIQHTDFKTYPQEVLDQLKGASGCVWALGISQTEVDADEYVKITKDFPMAAANAFRSLSAASSPSPSPFHFVYVSGEGATQTPSSYLTPIFGRVKGEAEAALAELSAPPHFAVDSVRPGFVDKYGHAAIEPFVPRLSMVKQGLMTAFGPALRLVKSKHSPTRDLGDFLVEIATGKVGTDRSTGTGVFELRSNGSRVVENAGFRRIMGLS